MRQFLALLTHKKLRKLLAIRWSGQAVDGIFQSGLASFVLFSPERQATGLSAALGFTVLLLPYSLIGPLVGTILDRISRQRIIFNSNLIRSMILVFVTFLVFRGFTGVTLTIAVLVAFGINRLLLAGLSAGLPLMIDRENLIKANALAVTGGTVFLVMGGGLGVFLRHHLDFLKNPNHSDGIVVALAAIGYAISTLLSARIERAELGPLPHEINSSNGFKELSEGWHFLRNHKDSLRGILATSCQRGGLTSLTIIALLLERNTFHLSANTEAGLGGTSLALAVAGVGIAFGAVIAPIGAERFGRHSSAITPFLIGILTYQWMLWIIAFVTAAAGQSMKVTNDALIQSRIIDDYRGRVFAIYDMTVNTGIVIGALFAALLIPTSGRSLLVPIAISTAYLMLGLIYLRKSKFTCFAPTI